MRDSRAEAAFLHITHTSRLLEVLRADNRAIVRAASQATKAANYLLGFLPPTGLRAAADPAAADLAAARCAPVAAQRE
jgi:antirestriction protein ArdC